MFNFIEYIDNYSNTSGSLRKYYRDKSTLDGTNNFIDFPADNNNRISIKEKITVKPGNNGTKDWNNSTIKIPKQFLGNLEMVIINCEVSFMLLGQKTAF